MEDTMVMPIPELAKGNEAQAYGAGLTYARRYALSSMFGIAADEDTDARPSPKADREKKAPVNDRSGNAADLTPPLPPEKMKKEFHAYGTKAYGDEWDDKRPELVRAITSRREGVLVGSSSSNDLYRAEMQHLIDGMKSKLGETN
jgi:hypothetical protein